MTDLMGAGAAAPPAPLPPAVLADAGAAIAAYLRLDDDAPDAGPVPIARLAAIAIGVAEAYLGTVLVLRSFEDVVAADGVPRRLAAVPVRTIAGATALPDGAAPVVLPADAYRVEIDADGCGFVRASGGAPLVAIAYAAGVAADWASLPAPIAHGVVMLAASLVAEGQAGTALPAGVAALWRPFRRLHLAAGRPGEPR